MSTIRIASTVVSATRSFTRPLVARLLPAAALLVATCVAPATASAVTKCYHGKNAQQICINFNRTFFGNQVRLDATWASVYQGSCGVGGDFHLDITVQSNDAVIKPTWQKLPGINKWTINGPHWKKYDTAADCWNGDADLHMPFMPLPPDRIRLAQKRWPKGYYVCAVLWNYHGGTNYSQDAVVCQKM